EVADFEHDMTFIEEQIVQDAIANLRKIEPRPCCIVFRPATVTDSVRFFKVNAPTQAVLEFCDGTRRMREIVAETEKLLGAANLYDAVKGIIERLFSLAVLTRAEHDTAMSGFGEQRGFGVSHTEGM